MISHIKKLFSNPIFLLILILGLGFFLREFDAVGRFGFSHDADLFSWIVKDVAIDHHLRLIGQETSTAGIFIGPLFYYALIPFFVITKMDPAGVLIFSALIGLATVFSFYWVFKKLFNQATGLIAGFFQAVLLLRVDHDRWIVPTITDYLWQVWFFYAILMLAQGNYSVMFLLGILVGLIWHINFSLAILLILIPLTFILNKKIPKLKQWLQFGLGVFIPSIPLILFEARHNFSQTKSFINSFFIYQGAERGSYRIIHVFDEATRDLTNLLFFPSDRTFEYNMILFLIFLSAAIFLMKKKVISKQILIVFYTWIFSTILFFMLSSKILSEYYFSSIYMIFMAILILSVSFFIKLSKQSKIITLTILILLSIYSVSHIILNNGYNNNGYNEKKAVVDYIDRDSKLRGFPCVAVSYITSPGEDVGFRYFFFLKGLHVNQSSSGSPDYTIVIPASYSSSAIKAQFGAIGIIPPKEITVNPKVIQSCSGINANLTDPFFGFVQ